MHLGEFVKESDILYDYFSENPLKKNLSNLMSTE